MQYRSNAVPTPFPSLLALQESQFPGETPFYLLGNLPTSPSNPTPGPGAPGTSESSFRQLWGSSGQALPGLPLRSCASSAAGPARAASLEGRAGGPLGPGGAGAGPGRGGRQGDASWRVRAGFLVRQRERFRGGQSRGPARAVPTSKEKRGQGASSRPPPESVVTVL